LLLSLYAATLVVFSSQDDSNASVGDPSATPDWTKVIGSVTSRFAKRVDLTNLNCNGQPVSSEFTLSTSNSSTFSVSSSCKIAFNSSSLPGEEDFWKTEISILPTGTKISPKEIKVYTKYYSAEKCGSRDLYSVPLPSPAAELVYLELEYLSDSGYENKPKPKRTATCWSEQGVVSKEQSVVREESKEEPVPVVVPFTILAEDKILAKAVEDAVLAGKKVEPEEKVGASLTLTLNCKDCSASVSVKAKLK
jgi:hypothetical protein